MPMCHRCKQEKDKTQFARISKGRLSVVCLECRILYKTTTWRERNPDRARELDRIRSKRRRTQQRVYHAKWRDGNRERFRKYYRDYQNKRLLNDPVYAERKRAAKRKWHSKNKERALEHNAIRRARELGSEFYEIIDRESIYQRDSGICHICGESVDPKKWHMDHIIPISKGGSHIAENVAVSHPVCNLRKSNRVQTSPPFERGSL